MARTCHIAEYILSFISPRLPPPLLVLPSFTPPIDRAAIQTGVTHISSRSSATSSWASADVATLIGEQTMERHHSNIRRDTRSGKPSSTATDIGKLCGLPQYANLTDAHLPSYGKINGRELRLSHTIARTKRLLPQRGLGYKSFSTMENGFCKAPPSG